jgi:DNA-binding transcriptional regulator YhcF (GntR family)
LALAIDKRSGTPVYRQIIAQITRAVQAGELAAGTQLPPERELARQLATARGTVNKAYEKLVGDHIIECGQGRGTFIAGQQNLGGEGRKEKALQLLEQLVARLEKLNFSHREIASLLHLILLEREKRLESIHIAAIDCNPEALVIFENQLLHDAHVRLSKLLLEEIVRDPAAPRKLAHYDLILTTSRHYAELCGLAPALKEKIIQAAVSPSQQTIIELAAISPSVPVGIICRSQKFLDIILNKLREFHLEAVARVFEADEEGAIAVIGKSKVLIIPPDSPLLNRKRFQDRLWEFREQGGTLIKFEYQMERGTLLYIEEKIARLLNARTA